MNLDHPNKNEKRMKETVDKYSAPFDPSAWEEMKSKLEVSNEPADEIPVGSHRKDSSIPPFVNLKNLFIMFIIMAFIFSLWTLNEPTTSVEPAVLMESIGSTEVINSDHIDHDKITETQSEIAKQNALKNSNASGPINDNTNLSIGNIGEPALTFQAKKTSSNLIEDVDERFAVELLKKNQFKSVGDNLIKLSATEINMKNNNRPDNSNFLTSLVTANEGGSMQNADQLLLVNDDKNDDVPQLENRPELKTFKQENVLLSTVDLLPTRLNKLTIEQREIELLANQNDPIFPVKKKRFGVALRLGSSYNSFKDVLDLNVVGGIVLNYQLNNNIKLQAEFNARSQSISNAKYFREESTVVNGIQVGRYTFERTLNDLFIFEVPLVVGFRPNINIGFSPQILIGVRPSIDIIPMSANATVVSGNQMGFQEPAYRTGIKRFDTALVLGFELPVTKWMSVDVRANLNFRDITEDTFWNVSPERNTVSDFQLSLKWNLFRL